MEQFRVMNPDPHCLSSVESREAFLMRAHPSEGVRQLKDGRWSVVSLPLSWAGLR